MAAANCKVALEKLSTKTADKVVDFGAKASNLSSPFTRHALPLFSSLAVIAASAATTTTTRITMTTTTTIDDVALVWFLVLVWFGLFLLRLI